MKHVLYILLLSVSQVAGAQQKTIHHFSTDHVNFEMEISARKAEGGKLPYALDISVSVMNDDTCNKYFAYDDRKNDSSLLLSFSPAYFDNKMLKCYIGLCDESRLPASCDRATYYFRIIAPNAKITAKKSFYIPKEIYQQLKYAQLNIEAAYLDDTQSITKEINENGKISYPANLFYRVSKKITLNLNMENFRGVDNKLEY